MQRISRMMIKILILIFLLVPKGYGYAISDYLITSDIGGFIASKNPTAGRGPGELAGGDHFYHDHVDMTYRISYFNLQTRVGPRIQVTEHAGSDSDKWLLHEIDIEFRNYYGIPGKSYIVKKIDGHTTITFGSGGWDYRWLSENKVILVEYTDLEMRKPEPLEVVKAYLAKHPSTLPPITATIQRSQEGITEWVKDEMDRRLWLSDKWFLQIQVGKVESSEALQTIVKSMNVFLDYREKYYNISAKSEKESLLGYLEARNGTAIKNKLTEYKTWWSVNKTKSINLP